MTVYFLLVSSSPSAHEVEGFSFILQDIEHDYKYKLQYEEDIIKGIRVERNKWKLATINVIINQNESILNELGVDLEEIKERVKKQNEKRKQGRDAYEKGS